LDQRSGYRKFVSAMLLEHIPGGAKWRYIWGSMLAFVFSIQLITGLLLMTSYSPGDSTAWGSVYFIQYEMQFGWLIRGLHHFGSQTMVVLLGIHMLQVVIAGAQLPPREVNWWLGLGLMACVLGLSLTGYLLPWDQKGYWATQVATNIAGNLPGLGSIVKRVLVGGPEYGNHTLTRFYTLHVGILPAALIGLLVLHIVLFRRHGITAPKDAKGEGMFWPDQAFKDMVGCMVMFGLLLAMVIWGGHGNAQEGAAAESDMWTTMAYWGRHGGGANLDAPADAGDAYPARPEWYFLFLFQLLKYFEAGSIIGTVIIPNGVGVLLFLLPLFGFGRMRPLGHVLGVLVVVGILAGAASLTLLAIADDMANPVGRYVVTELAMVAVPAISAVLLILLGLLALLPRGAFRSVVYVGGVSVLVVLTAGTALGLYGAMGAGLDDPGPQTYRLATSWWWPQVYKEAGANVNLDDKDVKHRTETIGAFRHKVHDADEKSSRAVVLAHRGIPPEGAILLLQRDPMTAGKALFKENCALCHSYGTTFTGGAMASDLAGFADADPKKREEWLRGLLHKPDDIKFLGGNKSLGRMAKWRKERDEEIKDMNVQQKKEFDDWLNRVTVWLASQPNNPPPGRRDHGEFAEAYRAFFNDEMSGYCGDCHKYQGKGGSRGPDLTGYMSAEWVRLMVLAPDHESRYPTTNGMPPFRETVGPGADVFKLLPVVKNAKTLPVIPLSDVERELIIRFLCQDDRLVFFGRPITGPPKDKKQ
jgi:quinol-cytochrome oxidoreductase complex cytochrome b subunit